MPVFSLFGKCPRDFVTPLDKSQFAIRRTREDWRPGRANPNRFEPGKSDVRDGAADLSSCLWILYSCSKEHSLHCLRYGTMEGTANGQFESPATVST